MSKTSVLHEGQNMLGEGPLWLKERNALCWVDILKNEVYYYDFATSIVRTLVYDKPVTLLLETESEDTLIVARQGAIGELSLSTGEFNSVRQLESDKPNSRSNDGGCDSMGRVWVGTMDLQFEEGAGNLYLLTDEGFIPKITNTTISNGLVWSMDGSKMYFIDSPLKTVKAYHFDQASASLALIADVVRIPEELGSPDGMAIDEEGMLWIAHYGGYSVGRWNPNNGELLEKIMIPAPNVTACTFGGPDMKTLFITTARQEMSVMELEEYPLSGSLFYIETNVRGIKKNKARGL